MVEIVRSYFIVPEEMSRGDPVLAKIFVEQRPEWVCWKTGLELKYMDSTLFSLKQVQIADMATGHSAGTVTLYPTPNLQSFRNQCLLSLSVATWSVDLEFRI